MKAKRLKESDLQALQEKVKGFTKAVKNIPLNREKIFLVGIDPDVEKCGFAVKDKSTGEITEVFAIHFFDVINRLNQLRQEGLVIVYVDAGWMIGKSNWHDNQGSRRGEKIAKNVGACHQVGKLIVEYCQRKGVVCHQVRPNGSKIAATAFAKMGLWKGRINQDMRDAVLLISGR